MLKDEIKKKLNLKLENEKKGIVPTNNTL